ncbi:HAD-IIA family hydrolase [Rhodospirillaceae bacterium SYSU D60014]|uniref:HAD-IIA family hydrolase n=1 Tax=Virgifigura deserti TaxID=2268457 RepID=UPI000E66BC14
MTEFGRAQNRNAPRNAATRATSASVRARASSWIDDTQGFIVDLDGTLVRGNYVIAGAVELLERIKDRYVILSNNSTDTAFGLATTLRKLGLRVEADRLILAGEHAIRFMAEHHAQARLKVIASPAIRKFAERQGLRLVDRDADFVVLGRDRRFNYAKLNEIVNELHRGASLVVTNPDLSHPAEDGGLIPETGALMTAVTACAGIQPDRVVGKPEDTLFLEALKRLGTRPSDTLVIGDNPATDAIGAVRLGMRYLLVGTTPYADATSPKGLLSSPCLGHAQVPFASPVARSWSDSLDDSVRTA